MLLKHDYKRLKMWMKCSCSRSAGTDAPAAPPGGEEGSLAADLLCATSSSLRPRLQQKIHAAVKLDF